jgi:multiple sugar transport system permease protein
MSEKRFAYFMSLPAALFYGLLVGYPIYLLVYNSFFRVDLISPELRSWVGFGNYYAALTSNRLRESAFLTLKYSLFALLFELLFGFCAALLFNEIAEQSRWHRTIFTLPLMVPPIVAGLLWRFLLVGNIGIVNYGLTRIGLLSSPDSIHWLSDPNTVIYTVSFADIWLTTSFVALVTYAGLANIPKDLIEAARLDGANVVKRFWHLTLPMMRPVLAVVIVVRGVDAAKTFDLIWIQTRGGPNHQSEVFSMNIYQRMVRYGDLGQASASATLFLIVMTILAVFAYWKMWRPSNG